MRQLANKCSFSVNSWRRPSNCRRDSLNWLWSRRTGRRVSWTSRIKRSRQRSSTRRIERRFSKLIKAQDWTARTRATSSAPELNAKPKSQLLTDRWTTKQTMILWASVWWAARQSRRVHTRNRMPRTNCGKAIPLSAKSKIKIRTNCFSSWTPSMPRTRVNQSLIVNYRTMTILRTKTALHQTTQSKTMLTRQQCLRQTSWIYSPKVKYMKSKDE